MTESQKALLDRSKRALKSAGLLLDHGDGPAAVNRAYYAAFWSAQAALMEFQEAPRTHTGVQGRFYIRMVETGLVPIETARTLGYANTLRQGADYDISPTIETEAIATLILDVESFCRLVDEILHSRESA
jgi:uncharacterized protein (UPF0332 family)